MKKTNTLLFKASLITVFSILNIVSLNVYAIGQPELLTTLADGERLERFQVTPDNTRIIYASSVQYENEDENGGELLGVSLYSVPIEGGTPVKLHGDIAPRATGVPLPGLIADKAFIISKDSKTVFFPLSQTTQGRRVELFKVASTGGTPELISHDFPAGWNVQEFGLTPDEKTVAYSIGIQEEPYEGYNYELYTVPASGGQAKKIHTLNAGIQPTRFYFSPDNNHLVFSTFNHPSVSWGFESIPISGGTVIEYISPVEEIASTYFIGFSSDGQKVIFVDGSRDILPPFKSRLFTAPLSEQGGIIQLGTHEGIGRAKVTADGQRVVYLNGVNKDNEPNITGERNALYSIQVSGGTAIRLDSALADTERLNGFKLSPDSQRVLYVAGEIDKLDVYGRVPPIKLFSVDINNTSEAINLWTVTGEALIFDGNNLSPDVEGTLEISNDSRTVLFSIVDKDGIRSTYITSIDVADAQPLDAGNNTVTDLQPRLTNDKKYALFSSNLRDEKSQLFRVATNPEDDTCYQIKMENNKVVAFCL